MCRLALGILLLPLASAGAQQRPAAVAGDSLSRLRERYAAEVRQLVPQWQAAVRAANIEDSLRAPSLPPDTIRAGAMRWLVDASQGSSVQDAVARSWSHLLSAFGSEAGVVDRHLFAARVSRERRDTSRRIIELAEVVNGRLDVFDRIPGVDNPDAIASRVLAHASKIILQNGDSAVLRWLQDPYSPEPMPDGLPGRLYAELVTSPSQVSSRCLAGDIRRCREALTLTPVPDPLTEWYDAGARRNLVVRMGDLLNKGPQKAQYDACVIRESDGVCERILRTMPRYVLPPPLPMAMRHHLFRIALQAGGAGAYERLASGPARSVEQRLADAARLPIDSLVSRWRADIVSARPPSPMPSLLTAWTTVAWGIAVLLIALRFAAWR